MTIGRDSGSHVGSALPALLNGTLGVAESAATQAHLAVCPDCRMELAEWEAITAATGLLTFATPPADVPASVWAKMSDTRPVAQPARSARWLASLTWQLLLRQVPLMRGAIWTASVVTISVGCLTSLLLSSTIEAGVVLAMVAPLVAALGVAFIYGPDNDPGLEMSLATSTPPQLVLAARLTLVYGFDLGVAILGTLVLATYGETGLIPLMALWLGPMLFLSALALVLSLLWGSTVAAIATMGLWLLRLVVALSPGYALNLGAFTRFGDSFWHQTPLLLALTAVLLVLAFCVVPRQERVLL